MTRLKVSKKKQNCGGVGSINKHGCRQATIAVTARGINGREVACEFIRNTEKSCMAYKILAASRKCDSPESVRAAFEYAFSNIKPNDTVNVGMFQKHGDQVGMNARFVREILMA